MSGCNHQKHENALAHHMFFTLSSGNHERYLKVHDK